jgi:hypothetical protein
VIKGKSGGDFMSLKAIEMQVAIPRTQNVGKIQDQLQQRGQVSQDYIASQQSKDDEKKRKQVEETEESERIRLNNDDDGREGSTFQESRKEKHAKKKEEQQQLNYAKHPYKGNYIDYSR